MDPHTEQFVREMTRCQNSVFAFILSLVPNADAARDILQNTNVVLWQKSAHFEPNTNFLAWAREVARQEVLAHRRDFARDRHLFDDSLLDRLAAAGESKVDDPDERAQAFERCLASLPSRQRDLVCARYSPGGSVRKIAESRGQSASAISVTLSRIRKSLADCIQRKLQGSASS
jgi:RNA polymerase sigma-70 factor (ECF subfamily)